MRALSTSQDDVESEADLVSREDLTVYKIVYNGPDDRSKTACKSLKNLVSAEGIEPALKRTFNNMQSNGRRL